MNTPGNRAVTIWLFAVAILIMIMVVLGGFVRLSEAGLSIVEWNPVSGVVPPIGEEAWQEEFAKYQQTPEFEHVNQSMTLAQYKEIFVIEYVHRLLGRVAGLFVAIPLFYFLFKGIIPWRKSAVYIAIALLFAFQGFLGWYMVSSGLRDVPAVSPYRLAIHLLMALFLLALTLWMAFQHLYGFPPRRPSRSQLAAAIIVDSILTVQISYGALMAGMDAGFLSNSWPLMFGSLLPAGLLSEYEPALINLVASPATVHFIHRWLAFGVLLVAGWFVWRDRRQEEPAAVSRASLWLIALIGLQILLGIGVVQMHVPLTLALLHQAVALVMFVVAVFITYRLAYDPAAEAVSISGEVEFTAV